MLIINMKLFIMFKNKNMKLLNRIINFINPMKPLRHCYVCGKIANYKHMSMIGQIPFYVCKRHHKGTASCIGVDENLINENNTLGNRMGLIDKDMKWVELKYYDKKSK